MNPKMLIALAGVLMAAGCTPPPYVPLPPSPEATAWQADYEKIKRDQAVWSEQAKQKQREWEAAAPQRAAAEAEKAKQRTAVGTTYWACVSAAADRLAIRSTETADVVAIAAVASCHSLDGQVMALFKPEGLDVFHTRFTALAVQRIVVIRAATPAPAPRRDTIGLPTVRERDPEI